MTTKPKVPPLTASTLDLRPDPSVPPEPVAAGAEEPVGHPVLQTTEVFRLDNDGASRHDRTETVLLGTVRDTAAGLVTMTVGPEPAEVPADARETRRVAQEQGHTVLGTTIR